MTNKDNLMHTILTSAEFLIKDDGTMYRTLAGKTKQVGLAKSSGGYLMYRFSATNFLMHRIIWQYFNKSVPDNLQINHINGIKTDNRLINLELVTQQQNTVHAVETGLLRPKFGQRVLGRTVINFNIAEQIRDLCGSGMTQKEVAEKYGLCKGHVSMIVNYKMWQDNNYLNSK